MVIVEHGVVQRRKDAVEGVVLAHEVLSPCGFPCLLSLFPAHFGEGSRILL